MKTLTIRSWWGGWRWSPSRKLSLYMMCFIQQVRFRYQSCENCGSLSQCQQSVSSRSLLTLVSHKRRHGDGDENKELVSELHTFLLPSHILVSLKVREKKSWELYYEAVSTSLHNLIIPSCPHPKQSKPRNTNKSPQNQENSLMSVSDH